MTTPGGRDLAAVLREQIAAMPPLTPEDIARLRRVIRPVPAAPTPAAMQEAA